MTLLRQVFTLSGKMVTCEDLYITDDSIVQVFACVLGLYAARSIVSQHKAWAAHMSKLCYNMLWKIVGAKERMVRQRMCVNRLGTTSKQRAARATSLHTRTSQPGASALFQQWRNYAILDDMRRQRNRVRRRNAAMNRGSSLRTRQSWLAP